MSDPAARKRPRDLGEQAQEAARDAANSRLVDPVARAGLVGRAVVYLMVGYLAGRVAQAVADPVTGERPPRGGQTGAVRACDGEG